MNAALHFDWILIALCWQEVHQSMIVVLVYDDSKNLCENVTPSFSKDDKHIKQDTDYSLCTHLKYKKDPRVSEVFLIWIVLHIAQASQNLKALTHTRPATLRAENLQIKYIQ